MKKSLIILLFFSALEFPQVKDQTQITGKVIFRSSENVYVKFDNTQGINAGDTLYKNEKGILSAAIIVKFLSSKSAAGNELTGKQIKIDDELTALISVIPEEHFIRDTLINKSSLVLEQPEAKHDRKQFLPLRKTYNGRFTIQSFSDLSNMNNSVEYQRWRYSFLFNTDEISGTPFSFSNYFIFSYRNKDIITLKTNLPQYLKVYDLAVRYKIDETSEILAGRHINKKITNISSIDGIQYEKKFSSFYTGAVAGARPDFNDMSFNFKLLEYGAYAGKTDSIGEGIMENTLAVMQQTNTFKTDRRFLYFQHNNDIIPKTNIFVSSEIDLFKRINTEGKNTFTLTGLFLSARYNPINEISFSVSYDARKDVIYYETYRSISDSIVESETRKGLRGGVNLRLFNELFIGLNAGYRFQKSDKKTSKNLNCYIAYANIPFINVVPSATFTKLESSYLEGTLWGLRFTKTLFDIADIGAEYRSSFYKFSAEIVRQRILSADLSIRISKTIYLSASYEGTFEYNHTWGRVLFDLTTRF